MHIVGLVQFTILLARVLAKSIQAEAQYIIFTDDPVKRYEDFTEEDFEQTDDIQGIKYEKRDIYDDTILLLRFNCPDSSCDVTCWNLANLQGHVRGVHHKFMCELCTKNKKVFMHEHELFTPQELRKHEKFGDDNPGAVDQSGFKGHPDCGFCQQRFYGDDELYVHCRDQHERCHICDRRQQGGKQQYYINYDSLEIHFREKHFLCADRECIEKKFVVFESEMDLKAHQLETHPQGLSKDARKDARRVDISSFDYRTPHQGSSRGGRRNRDDRGWRDPNAEPLPQSSAQPLRRDELAYQRQQAIQSAQSITTRTFGGQLTQPSASSGPAYAGRSRNQEPATVTASRTHTSTNPSFPPIDNLSLNPTTRTPENLSAPGSPSLSHVLTPQEQARRIHHTSVMNRASDMLHANLSKTAEFRAQVSSYRQSSISAQQLIDSFLSLFDAPASELGKLIKELADIYESETKRNELLKAWNDWKAVHEDYPSLPGPISTAPSDTQPSSGGRRILKLKSSTAQSSRSAVSKQGSWGSSGPSGSSNPFPPIASGASASANRAGAGKTGPVPWATPSSSARPSPAPSRPVSTAPSRGSGVANDAFPALPAAQRPNTTMMGLHRGAVNWGNGGTKVQNAWGVANGTSASTSTTTSGINPSVGDVEDDFEGGGGKKGKKAKKTTLYKFG